MKKSMIALILAIALIISLAGCQVSASGGKMPESMAGSIGKKYTSYDGVQIDISHIQWQDGKLFLDVDWSNNTDKEVVFGEMYMIERLEDGKWVSCVNVENLAFHMIAYILLPGQTRTEIYVPTYLFDVSKAGTYRFLTDCTVGTKYAVEEKCDLWAEFTLEEPIPESAQAQHTHQIPKEPQNVEDPYSGYCGNTATTIYLDGKEVSFMFGNSVTLTDILLNLRYQQSKVCRCAPEYTVDTEFGKGYHINLTHGFVRCEDGQADLTQEQIDQITEIVEWAKKNPVCDE